MESWLAMAVAVFACALGLVRVLERRAGALGLLDLPNPRSSHVAPRPRGGGLGILIAILAGLTGAALLDASIGTEVWVVVVAASLVSLVGLRDDMRPIAVWPRLAVQIGAAVAVIAVCGALTRLPLPPPFDVQVGAFGWLLALIWIVGVTNFFNFMDGADGLAAGQAIITLALLAWAVGSGGVAGLAVIGLAATAAFLTRNWSPARIFLGDVGSSLLGFLLAALPFAAPAGDRPRLVFIVAVSLALFLLDPTLTLLQRSRRGAALGAAHREHLYQQFFEPDQSHAKAVAGLLAAGLALSAVAALTWAAPHFGWVAIALAAATFAGEWILAHRRRAPTPPLDARRDARARR